MVFFCILSSPKKQQSLNWKGTRQRGKIKSPSKDIYIKIEIHKVYRFSPCEVVGNIFRIYSQHVYRSHNSPEIHILRLQIAKFKSHHESGTEKVKHELNGRLKLWLWLEQCMHKRRGSWKKIICAQSIVMSSYIAELYFFYDPLGAVCFNYNLHHFTKAKSELCASFSVTWLPID